MSWGSKDNKRVFNFKRTDIPLSENKTYYVYLWTCWSQSGNDDHYYPDNLFCKIRVKDGKVSYSISDDIFIDLDVPNPNPNPNPNPASQSVANYNAPETGDASVLSLWTTLMVVSTACVAVIFRKTRKEM